MGCERCAVPTWTPVVSSARGLARGSDSRSGRCSVVRRLTEACNTCGQLVDSSPPARPPLFLSLSLSPFFPPLLSHFTPPYLLVFSMRSAEFQPSVRDSHKDTVPPLGGSTGIKTKRDKMSKVEGVCMCVWMWVCLCGCLSVVVSVCV